MEESEHSVESDTGEGSPSELAQRVELRKPLQEQWRKQLLDGCRLRDGQLRGVGDLFHAYWRLSSAGREVPPTADVEAAGSQSSEQLQKALADTVAALTAERAQVKALQCELAAARFMLQECQEDLADKEKELAEARQKVSQLEGRAPSG
ncbi:hypothetical protein AK812_SmicGene15390 [Symbiodinium microadriaticum]|uniref:Uncharacterized protein n=1 Tax=Symbiodinium microadriaticum TaxID=2951 RepID=A0A1Q9E320_SYMMI|nr:hypothetical protein AK812_SmicGene15390 [Symbiodinium microadriaticum]